MRTWVAVALVLVVVVVIVGSLKPKPAEAHQPRMVIGAGMVEVTNPEVSQAFYAVLAGRAAEYRIRADQPLRLYVAILTPDLPDRRADFRAQVMPEGAGAGGEALLTLDGVSADWHVFDEPFVGDRYYQGPEGEVELPAGTYVIRVTNPDGQGRYVLAVGRRESFTLRETLTMLRVLPSVKRYFGKSPWTAYLNPVGAFALAMAALAAWLIVLGLGRVIRAIRR